MSDHIEHSNRGGDEGLRHLAIFAGLEFEDVLRLAERRQLHLAIERANSPEGRARARRHRRLLEQRHGITPTPERSTRNGREALLETMRLWRPVG